MRSLARVGCALILALVVIGCSEDAEPETPQPEALLGCGEASFRDQLVVVRFKRTDPKTPELDAHLARFFDETLRPCVIVGYELPKGWRFDHYTVSYETAFYRETLTVKRDDAPDPFLIAETEDCAQFAAEVVIRQQDRTARYTAKTRMGPVCTPLD
ncbi:MAG TPA: hypothetical protein VLI04_18010 [Nocardioidaceae bacterium]|nr:hypothetical protein [Nocardioidaceae bacterium]